MLFRRKTLDVIAESREVIDELRRLAERLAVYVDDLEHNGTRHEGENGGKRADRAS